MINKRLFGSPLLPSVQKKLEDRQRVAEKIAPGESVPSHFVTAENENIADLSSRTPAVRMWTSVSLINKEITAEIYEEYEIDKNDPDVNIQNYKKLSELKTRLPGSRIIELNDKMYLKADTPERDAIKYANKIYVIGNNQFNTHTVNPNQSSINERLEYYSTEMEGGNVTSVTNASEPPEEFTSNQLNTIEAAFPQTQKHNQFLKPAAGIISVQSTTEGMVGAIKKTTINFVVHNFNDFDKIYSRYFLKPGATVFIDFGWSTNLFYDPDELINDDDPVSFLYGEPDKGDSKLGKITQSNGDFETLQGIVTNYDSKIEMNGSVNCSLTITSPNNALLNFQINDTTKRRIKQILEHGVLYLAVKPTLNKNLPADVDDFADFSITPNIDTSSEDIVKFNNNLNWLAGKHLGNNLLTPGEQRATQNFEIVVNENDKLKSYEYSVDTDGGNSIRTGVFIDTLDANEVYISLGLFEDLIINSQFGFGKDEVDINKGNRFQVRMDSSNSFTYWDSKFIDRQKTLASIDEDTPKFLIPTWWGNSAEFANNESADSTKYKEILGSYTEQAGKYPIDAYEKDDDHVTVDKAKSRIPIREIFISADLIIEAFDKEDNVQKVINYIIKDINKDSHGAFNLLIKMGQTDSEIQIIDENFLETQQEIDSAGLTTDGDSDDKDSAKNTKYEELFKFNATSGKSIIRGYDVSFDIPSGNIGNMYAINAMSHEDRIFPLDEMLDMIMATSALDDSLSFIYEPDMSAYRASQIGAAGDSDATLVETYERAKDLLSNNIYDVNAVRTTNETIIGDLFNNYAWHPGAPEADKQNKRQKTKAEKNKEYENQRQKVMDAEIERAQGLGYKVMDSFDSYWMLRITREIIVEKRPTVLPMKLSITIYGISSIVPGDTFRVDYLPQFYVDKVYFQTIQVEHTIEPSGWYTTLNTQFRIRPSQEKIEHYANLPERKIVLSPKALEKLPLYGYTTTPQDYPIMTKEDFDQRSAPFKQLVPFMRNIRVVTDHHYQHIDLVLSFRWIKPHDEDPDHKVDVYFPAWNWASNAGSVLFAKHGLEMGTEYAGMSITSLLGAPGLVYQWYRGDDIGIDPKRLDIWGAGYGAIPSNLEGAPGQGGINYSSPQNNHLPFQRMFEGKYYLFVQGKFWAIVPISRAQKPPAEIEEIREQLRLSGGPQNQADRELQKALDNYDSNEGYGDMFDYNIKAELFNNIEKSDWDNFHHTDNPSMTAPEDIELGKPTRDYSDKQKDEAFNDKYGAGGSGGARAGM
jgi:hypothetical protein